MRSYHPTYHVQKTPSSALYDGPKGIFIVGVVPVWACQGKKGTAILPVDAFYAFCIVDVLAASVDVRVGPAG